MLESGTDPESYIAEYTLVYEEKVFPCRSVAARSQSTRTVQGVGFRV